MNTHQPKQPRRPHGRHPDQLRPVGLSTDVLRFAEGSAQIDMGDTRVLVAATVETKVPKWLSERGSGWVTAEYAMLPRATSTRNVREAARGKRGGRTLEIQRLIGRSLRAAVDLELLGPVTVILDCDVIQADGGTRTASVTAAWVALVEALGKAYLAGDIARWPLRRQIAAVSVGYLGPTALLDLEYCEDSVADVDMNVVATPAGELVEVQGTGEQRTFTRAENDRLLDLALAGVATLAEQQNEAVAGILADVEAKRQGGRRRTPPKDESTLWGAPPE